MSRQQEFDFGIPIPPLQPKRPDRVFFALFLQAKDRAAFWSVQRHLCDLNGITGSLLLKERFHVSQQHVGDYKRLRPKIEFAAKRAGRLVEMPAFEVTFRHAVSFPGRPAAKGKPPSRPFVLLADDGPVCELSRLIGSAMKANGLKSADQFVPHMTLAYDARFIPKQPIDPISFLATEFHLIHSLRGRTIYIDLDCWPLMTRHSTQALHPDTNCHLRGGPAVAGERSVPI